MAGRDWSEKSDSSIEEKLCVCVWGGGWRQEREGRSVKAGGRRVEGGGWRVEEAHVGRRVKARETVQR